VTRAKIGADKMEKALNILFPPKCFGCGANSGYFCHQCMLECKVARHFYCVVCDKPSVVGETHECCKKPGTPVSIFSPFEYKGLVRKCIMRAKYRSRLFAPLKTISREAADIASKCGLTYENYIVISIPLSGKRAKERGFNQAEFIARAVADRFSITYQDSFLVRNKETKAQHKKTREERFKNLENAFIVKKDLQGQKILVVDDICTTGATLLEAARALHQAGAKEIKCFTLAKEF